MDPVRIALPVPFPIATVNAWLLPGRQPALIDCGVASSRSYSALMAGLDAAGADPAALSLHITHGHVDHAGNAARLRREHGVRLAAHASEAPFVETFRRDEVARNDAYATALRQHGMPDDDVARLRADSDAIDRFLEDVPIGHHHADGGTIVLGDHDATVLHTPGHTPGSLCYLRDDQILFTGDTLLQHITSNALELREHDFGNYHQYMQSLEALRRYAGVIAYPGHKDPFRITDAILDEHTSFHAARAARIAAIVARDGPITAWQVMRRAFPDWSSDPQLFMGMAEIVGHLHALTIEGRIERIAGDEVRFR